MTAKDTARDRARDRARDDARDETRDRAHDEARAVEPTTVDVVYPRWAHQVGGVSQVVHSEAEALALGEGWSWGVTAPVPVVTALDPDTVAIGAPSFTLHVIGTGFAPGAVIVFAGHDEPTTILDDTVVTTGVDMAVWVGPDAVPVTVRVGEVVSNALDFTFTEAAG